MEHVDPTDETRPAELEEEAAAIGFPVTSSVDKLRGVVAELGAIEPDDPMQAAMLAMFAAFAPQLASLLPDDPDELDALCLTGAKWMLGLRSDDAWQPADLDELFMGPPPADASRVDAELAGTDQR